MKHKGKGKRSQGLCLSPAAQSKSFTDLQIYKAEKKIKITRFINLLARPAHPTDFAPLARPADPHPSTTLGFSAGSAHPDEKKVPINQLLPATRVTLRFLARPGPRDPALRPGAALASVLS